MAKKSIAKAHDKGFRLRPSQPKTKLSGSEADKLLEQNKAFAKMCSFDTIQPAIDKSGNNDRVVIMPGRYTEPKSRKAPVNDPDVLPVAPPIKSERRPGSLVRVPIDLPARPEPALRAGSRH